MAQTFGHPAQTLQQLADELAQHEAAPAPHSGHATIEAIAVINAELATLDAAIAAAIYTAHGELVAHAADTTAVHGIANTANLVLTGDSRLSDARTPTAHTHPESEVTGLVTDLAALAAGIDASATDADLAATDAEAATLEEKLEAVTDNFHKLLFWLVDVFNTVPAYLEGEFELATKKGV
jgi:hypothetical protein